MDKIEKRMNDILAASKSEWNRLVEENTALQEELSALGDSYGFPVSSVSLFYDWLDNNPVLEQEFTQRLRVILAIHNITREEWFTPLWYRVALGKDSPLGPSHSIGYPRGRYYVVNNHIRHEFIIDADTDLDNPLIQEYIRRKIIQYHSIPKPIPMKGKPRKLDWRPVWEWHKRNPNVGVTEIAKALGYDRAYISRKLNELNDPK